MSSTGKLSFKGSDGWQPVALNSKSCTIQLLSAGPILVHVGSTTPSGADGMILDSNGYTDWSGNDMELNDNVYVKAIDEDNLAQRIAFMKTSPQA